MAQRGIEKNEWWLVGKVGSKVFTVLFLSLFSKSERVGGEERDGEGKSQAGSDAGPDLTK